MEQIELKVTNREILGKKVRFLRRQGVSPVHLFGRGIESVTLQCATAELQRVLVAAGRTGLISLKLDKERSPRTAMVREVQMEPRTGELLHVDFYQVQMAEQVKVEVPIVLIGEAPALKLRENMLVQDLNTLTVECLPARIPSSVEVDLSSLTEPDQVVRVKDIELDKEISVLNDPESLVVRISVRPVEKIEEEEVVAEEVVAAEEAVEAPEAAPSAEAESKEE